MSSIASKLVSIAFLICSLLFSSMVWACDSHDEAFMLTEEEVWDQDSLHPQHLIDYEFNDHSCHGALHLSALPVVFTYNTRHIPDDIPKFEILVFYYSLTHTPPTPPPTL